MSLLPITDVAFVRTALVGDNDVVIAVQQNAGRAKKGQISGEGRMTIQKARPFSSRSSGQMERRMITGSLAVTWRATFIAADDGLSIMQVNGRAESEAKPLPVQNPGLRQWSAGCARGARPDRDSEALAETGTIFTKSGAVKSMLL